MYQSSTIGEDCSSGTEAGAAHAAPEGASEIDLDVSCAHSMWRAEIAAGGLLAFVEQKHNRKHCGGKAV
jgi:hypothetical protein